MIFKGIFSLISSLFFIFLVGSIFTNSVYATGSIIYFNDFESDQLGVFPAGWEVRRNHRWDGGGGVCMNGASFAEWTVEEIDGSKRAGITISGPGCVYEISPIGLEIPDLSNYEYELDMTFSVSGGSLRNIAYRYESHHRWYGLQFLDNKEVFLQKFYDGPHHDQHPNFSFEPSFQSDQTYNIRFRNIGDNVEIFIDDSLVHSFTDVDPIVDSGSFALQASVGQPTGTSVVYFDNIKVTDLSTPPPTPTPDPPQATHFLQTDPLWSDHQYNHIDQTIGGVGCALTSAAMNLTYHGIDVVPWGETLVPLTPGSLNQWLNTGDRPDMWGRGGAMSWTAMQYLTKTLNEIDESYPKLEHRRIPSHLLSHADEIMTEQGHPVIFKHTHPDSPTGVHFGLATSVVEPLSEYSFLDPFYADKDTFSIPPESLQSVEYFYPTNSDFSYLVVQADDQLEFSLTNPSGKVTNNNSEDIPQSYYSIEWPLADSLILGEVSGDPYKELAVKHPEIGEYLLALSSDNPGYYNFEIYINDPDANVISLVQEVLVLPGTPTVYRILYNPDDPEQLAKIVQIVDFDSLIAAINYAYDQGWIKNNMVRLNLIGHVRVSQLVYSRATHAGINLLRVFQGHIDRLNAHRQKPLTDQGHEFLESQLNLLLNSL